MGASQISSCHPSFPLLSLLHSTRLSYQKLKNTNESLGKTLESQQENLDELDTKRKTLEEEISTSHVKQEAVRLHEQIHALELKRDNLLNEIRNKETPQVKRGNSLNQIWLEQTPPCNGCSPIMGAGNSLKVASSMSLAKELPNPLQGICPLAINNNNEPSLSRILSLLCFVPLMK